MISLNRDDVTKLKGMAIFAIVFHNFFHLIFYKTKENEIDFHPSRFEYFLSDFLFSPSEWVQSLFTYFGHFGVQIFIFLSAYCLAISYPNIGWRSGFMISRVKKLYPTFVICILLWTVVSGVHGGIIGPLNVLVNNFKDIMLLLVGLYPLVPGNEYPMVGPWWFISYIMQFYVFWVLISALLNKTSNSMLLALIAIGVLTNLIVTYVVKLYFDVNLLLTPLGHLPEIFLGVYFARVGVSKSWLILSLSFVGLAISGISRWMWPIHYLSALLVFLIVALRVLDWSGERIKQGIYWLGVYSLPIFLVNGFLRDPFVNLARETKAWWMDITMGVLFFCLACFVGVLVAKILLVIEQAARRFQPKG